MLVRRAIEPGYGMWVFPGGYVDRGEALTRRRDPRSARGVRPRRPARRPRQHLLVPRPRADHRRLRGDGVGGELCGDDECLEARLFDADEIPWDELAFRSTTEALRDYLDGDSARSATRA